MQKRERFERAVRVVRWLALIAVVGACDSDDPARSPGGTGGRAGAAAGGAGGRTGGTGGGDDAGQAGVGEGGSGADVSGGSSGSAGSSATTGGRAGASSGGRGGNGGSGGSGADAGTTNEAGMPSSGGTSGGAGTGGNAGSGGTLPVPGVDSGAATRLAMGVAQCSEAGTLAVIEALARAGIETIDNATGDLVQEVVPPIRGLHVWRSQASAMACDIANGSGIRGQDLNDMIGAIPLSDTDSLDFSWLLAAYVTVDDGPFGAKLAAALMGSARLVDHATLVYPSLVVTTFLREVMLPMLAEAEEVTPRMHSRDKFRTAEAGVDPCAAISEFLDDLPSAVSNAVGSLSDDEDGFWGTIVSVAATAAGIAAYATAEAARGIIQHLPGMDAARAAAAAASAVADIRSMFTNWELTLTPPDEVHKSVGGTRTGTFTLTVQAPEPGSDWPAPLQSCADLLNVPLPNFGTADGSSVDWKKVHGFEDPAVEHEKQTSVTGQQATYTLRTVTEPETIHEEGFCQLTTTATVRAELGLPGLENLGSTLAGLMGSPLAQGAVSAGAGAAATLLGPSKEGTATISYHATIARIDVDGATEQIHVSSNDGIGPNGSWSGTWSSRIESTGVICGAYDVKPAAWSFSSGTANLSLSFNVSGGVMSSCSLTFSETLTIEPDFSGDGCALETQGSYNSVMIPPMGEPLNQSGVRDESYTITLVPEY